MICPEALIRNICWSTGSIAWGEMPRSRNPGIVGEATLSIRMRSTVSCHRRTRQQFRHGRQRGPDGKRYWNQNPVDLGAAGDGLKENLVRVDARAAEFVGGRGRYARLQHTSNRFGYVAHISRLQSCISLPKHRIGRKPPEELRQNRKEAVIP